MIANDTNSVACLFETENGIVNGNVEPYCSPECLAEALASRNSNIVEGASSKSSFDYIPQCTQCGISCWSEEATSTEEQTDDDLFPRSPMTDEEIILAWNESAPHESMIVRLRNFERHVALRCLNVVEDMEGGVSEIVESLMDILPNIGTSENVSAENIAVEALYIAIDRNRTVSKYLHYLKIKNPLHVLAKAKQLQSMANIDDGISTIAYLMNNADFEWASTQAEDMGTDASTELVCLLDTLAFNALDEHDNQVETISISIPVLEELLKTSKDGMLFFAPEDQEEAFKKLVMGEDQIVEESAYTNHYTHCGQNWEMTADSQCNDRCPACNAEIEPNHSVEIK